MIKQIRRAVSVQRTARLIQLAGKYDLPTSGESVRTWDVSIDLPATWSVGVIVGPSMAGKTTLARELFGEVLETGCWTWPADKCVADGFPKSMTLDAIAGLLSSVGFSSPPDWLKPYGALSNGGKFRVDLARSLAERDRAVIDEFGSFVHAQARQVAAAAAAKAARRLGKQLVALCVHDDAVPFLVPDWVIDVQPGSPVRLKAVRGSVQRPRIQLRIERTAPAAWERFRHHHYLSHSLHPGSKCFVAYAGDEPAAFTAVLSFPHAIRPAWREHRTVCLPDFQGVGIGNAVSEFVASLFLATGKPYLSTTSHPSMIRHRARSPLWKMARKPGLVSGTHGGAGTGMSAGASVNRITAGFEYVGPARRDEARALGVI